MSNVLIGIIGVILFIGLALAGALILGDDFRESTNSSRAAQTISQMKQASDAITMYELKTGRAITPGTPLSALVPRFLKSLPVLPAGTEAPRVFDDYAISNPAGTNRRAVMTASMIGTDAAASSGRSASTTTSSPTTSMNLPTRPSS